MIKPGIPEFCTEFIHVYTSLRRASCTSLVCVCCRLLSLSMDNSTVLGFPDTSGDYKGLVSIEPCTNRRRCPDLGPGLVGWDPTYTYYWFSVLQRLMISFICVYLWPVNLTLTKPLLLVLVAISRRAPLLFVSFLHSFCDSCQGRGSTCVGLRRLATTLRN